jgi:transposase
VTARRTREPARAQGRRRAGRRVRYPSDLTDAQWQAIAAHLPAERPGRRGRPPDLAASADHRGDHVPGPDRGARGGTFPPWQTVYCYFAAWRDDGTLARLHAELRALVRTAAGRKPQPTAAVIDSQSARAADTVPRASRGWDNAKKVNGRKRHIALT